MEVKTIKSDLLDENCFLVVDKNSGKGVVIDPGARAEKILNEVVGVKVEYLFLTHNHFDHIRSAREIKKATGAKIIIGAKDAEGVNDLEKNYSFVLGARIEKIEIDCLVSGGEKFKVGKVFIEIISTPGHTGGGICLLVKDEKDSALFTGDTLFRDGMGRTDLVGGSSEELEVSLKKLEKIIKLHPGIKVFPGHGLSFCPFA